MPEISPIGPELRPRLASSSQFVDDQINVLRRRVAASVENGALSAADSAAITRQLDDIQQRIDAGAANASLSRADLRHTSEALHAINRRVILANRAAATANAGTPQTPATGRIDITA